MPNIHFFKEDIRFRLFNQQALRRWITSVVRMKKFHLEELNFIFCSDDYLLQLNKNFLHHHFYTDVITFDNSDNKKKITGDIFISYDRVKENAGLFNCSLNDELHRVMIHGVLHLLGYKDKTKTGKIMMRLFENKCLAKRNF